MEIVKSVNGDYIKVLRYEASCCEPEVLGSGSSYSRGAYANTEKEALTLLADGRNELTRTVRQTDGRLVSHWYDAYLNVWRDSRSEIV